jgi:hypothetical protein
MENCVLSPLQRGSREIQEQLDILEKEVLSMVRSIHELELELEMRNRQHVMSTKLFKELKNIIAVETRGIIEAKGFLRQIWNIPFDVWRIIFKLVVDDKLDTFLHDPNAYLLRSEALKLSQVCHHWRKMTNAAPELWRYVSAPSHPLWPPNEHKILLHAISRSSESITLVYNLSQSYAWGYRGYQVKCHWDEKGNHIPDMISVNDGIFSTREYSIQYHVVNELNDISQRAADAPFCQPRHVTLSVLPSACRSGVFSPTITFDKTVSLFPNL